MTKTGNNYDAVIIGGGPAGASAAAILAGFGHRVLVLEREKFPRYHVGESMIPFTFQPLEKLGLVELMKRSAFQKKYSVQFVAPNGKASQPFYFFNRYDKETVAQTWQVLRSEFDEMLLNHARAKGAEVHEEITVIDLLREGAKVVGVRARQKDGTEVEFHAPITLDATGKEAFSTVRNGWRIKAPFLNKVAVWTYYRGSKRESGIDEGQTTVAMIPDKGWFWHIPQHNDMVSVGVVAEGKYLSRAGLKDPQAIFAREIGENLWIKEHLSHGRSTGEYFITSEYSFHSRHCGCEGLLLIGDAFCFLDPVFSSGLLLALKSGVMAGEDVHLALTRNDFSPSWFECYARSMRQGIENMRKLVYAFYNPNFSFKQVIDKYPEAADEITDCLSGDVNKDFEPLWKKIREFAPLPDDLPVGAPLTH
ncbi:MAG: NAD(P)/FAD-dependent oxidoreductase [Verrucomicrobiota bacterium]